MRLPKLWRSKAIRTKEVVDWRKQITRPASVLEVGGFRPTNSPLASCFGEVRVALEQEKWPHRKGKPLWPVCQLNLLEAPMVPDCLNDLAMIQFFVAEDYVFLDNVIADTSDNNVSSFFVRTYTTLNNLVQIDSPSHGSKFLPFEARWKEGIQTDYPTHDTMPIDFDALGIGDYYEQEEIDRLNRTKIGGWPSCIQSEPWWDYSEEGKDFEYVLQIDSEEKSKCSWFDGGTIFVARHSIQKNMWAFDLQST